MATATITREPHATAARLNRRDIEAYLSLADRKRQLEREARDLGKQMEPLSERFTRFVSAELKRNRKAVVRSCGFLFSLVPGGVRPAWKQAFIARLGERAASRVITSTPPSMELQIEEA